MGPAALQRRIMRPLLDLARRAPHPMFVTLAIMITKLMLRPGRHGVQMLAFCRGHLARRYRQYRGPVLTPPHGLICDFQNPECHQRSVVRR
jgi:hypothetical protein